MRSFIIHIPVENFMKNLLVAVFVSLFAMSTAYAQTTNIDSCETRAVSKDGKPLYGAAKAVSVKKCEQDRAKAKTGKK